MRDITDDNVNIKLAKETYDILFRKEQSKINAFENIVSNYYLNNFGSMSKADMELLLFSIYLDQCMETWPDEPERYSDFQLAKIFGITQTRIRSLREKKELKYPSEFKWEEKFPLICEKAEYESGKVRLFVRDSRLYNELCNIVMDMGSYSETTMTRNLLIVSPPVFVDLMVAASDEQGDKEMRKKLQKILKDNKIDEDEYLKEEKTFRQIFREAESDLAKEILLSVLKEIPLVGNGVAKSAEKIMKEMKKKIEKQQ